MRVLRGTAALLGAMAAVVSVGLLSWSLWPMPREQLTTVVEPERLVASVAGSGSEVMLQQIGDGLRLTLDTPRQVRIGEAGTVRLSLIPLQAEAPSPEGGDGLMAVARLRGPGMIVSPPGARGEPLGPGRATVFEWQVLAPRQSGASMTLALGVRLVPVEAGEAIEVPIWAWTFDMRVSGLGSLSAANTRWLALGGIGAGLALLGFSWEEWQVWLARRMGRKTRSAS